MSKRRRLVTELDYQILLLEHKKKLSTFERIKLDNLRERKQAMEEAGVELTATVVLDKATFEHQVESANTAEALNNETDQVLSKEASENDKNDPLDKKAVGKSTLGKGGISAYTMFLKQQREYLKKDKPGTKLDLTLAQEKWRKLSKSEKKSYANMAEKERKMSGRINTTEKKERKRLADKNYKERKKIEMKRKREEEISLLKKMNTMVNGKADKIAHLKSEIEQLKGESLKLQETKKSLAAELVEKDLELLLIKEKYKALHKIHKSCP